MGTNTGGEAATDVISADKDVERYEVYRIRNERNNILLSLCRIQYLMKNIYKIDGTSIRISIKLSIIMIILKN